MAGSVLRSYFREWEKNRSRYERKKILIVEDEEEIAMLEQDYLEINGFQTRIESDGEQAVELALTGEFDLILLDLMLPGKNGYDICREIRDKVDVPILMVTARTESIDKVLGLGLGADDYISKPFDPAELVARVKSHLNRYERLTKNGEPQNGTEGREKDVIKIDGIEIHTRKAGKYFGTAKRSASQTVSLNC